MEQRKSNFELLRIISMFFIIIWHIIIHGNLIENSQNEILTILLTILKYILVVHVNSFVLVTGYFQSKSKFKFRKLLSLILEVIFYSIIIYLIGIKTGIVEEYNYLTIFDRLNLNALGQYWFVKTYVILYILSDYINIFINNLTKQQLQKFILIVFIVFSIAPIVSGGFIIYNDGYNFYHFIYMYIIGATLRKYPLKNSYYFKNLSSSKYRIVMLSIFILVSYLNYSFMVVGSNFGNYGTLSAYINKIMTYNSMAYSNPFVIIQSVSFFELFNTLNIKNKVINFISKYVFGIYLIHDNSIIRAKIYKLLGIDEPFSNGKIFIEIIVIALIIFLMCVVIDIIREKIFKIVRKMYLKVSSKKRYSKAIQNTYN